MLLNLARNVSRLPVPLYGISFINECGILGADMLAADCDILPTDSGGTVTCVGGCTAVTHTMNWPVSLAC